MTARHRAIASAVAPPLVGAGLALVAATYAVSLAVAACADGLRLAVALMLGGVRP